MTSQPLMIMGLEDDSKLNINHKGVTHEFDEQVRYLEGQGTTGRSK